VAKDIAAHLGVLQPLLEDHEPFFVLGKEGDRYAMHGWNLNYVPAVACYEEMRTPRSDFRNGIPRPTIPFKTHPDPQEAK
jgi:hypothetical protein